MDSGMEIFALREMFDKNESASITALAEALLQFKCSRDKDIQHFLHNDAIQYENSNRARTYLYIDNRQILGYFAIAIRDLEIQNTVSKNMRKKLTYGLTDINHVPAYLIGQLAKCDNCSNKIGKLLIDASVEYIKKSQRYVGGRIVYLECKQELCSYYEKLRFNYLQDNKQLKQMIQVI